MASRRRGVVEPSPPRDWEEDSEVPVPDDDDEDFDLEGGWEASSDEEVDPASVPQGDQCGNKFAEFCLEQLHMGKMSAKTMCTLCYWASRAGASGNVKDFSLKPTSQSGKFQNHIDKALGFNVKDDGHLFRVKTPMFAKHDVSRSSARIPIQ